MENPLTTARHQLHYTQHSVARELGYTNQMVLRAEQGLFTTVPPKLKAWASTTLGSPPSEVEHMYQQYQKETRASNFSQLHMGYLNYLDMEIPSGSKEHPFVYFRACCSDSRVGFCKLLCLHPQILINWERSHFEGEWHPIIEGYLLDAGFNPIELKVVINKMIVGSHGSGIKVAYGSATGV